MTTIENAQYEIEKATWGQGPWLVEPDHKEWRDAATGYPCMAHRQKSLGHWCGYVAVPPGHPAHGKDYDHAAVEVHGGLTYAAACDGELCHVPAPGEPDNVWWLGFDCAHSGDLCPAMAARDKERGWLAHDSYDSYKPLSYIEQQCATLAAQLHSMQ